VREGFPTWGKFLAPCEKVSPLGESLQHSAIAFSASPPGARRTAETDAAKGLLRPQEAVSMSSLRNVRMSFSFSGIFLKYLWLQRYGFFYYAVEDIDFFIRKFILFVKPAILFSKCDN
jgi:hypothetical protein